MSLEVIPVAAFRDNYIWVIRAGSDCVAVDPGDAAPVQAFLDASGCTLRAILNTHHHDDHVGGNHALVARYPVPVLAPARESIADATVRVRGGSVVRIDPPELEFAVIDVPGHTRDHVAFYGHGMLFCGDTLFACGCGRLFEGTPQQMVDSLDRLAALPGDTRVYCGHEYTRSNIRFARLVEPDHAGLAALEAEAASLTERGVPTLPSTIERERATNPFLRSRDSGLAHAVSAATGCDPADPVAVFAALREWKNRA